MRRGFTLIELLVVIAVIAVLAGLLYPVLAGARERAQQSQCASNLHQIGAALQMYAADADGFEPPLGWPDPSSGRLRSWKDLLEPYLKTRAVWLCPSNPVGYGHFWEYIMAPGQTAKYTVDSWSKWPLVPASYDANSALHDPPQAVGSVADPAGTIEVFESTSGFSPQGWKTVYINSSFGTQDSGKFLPVWHHGGGNWLFVDGHVRWLRPRQTFAPHEMRVPAFTPTAADKALKRVDVDEQAPLNVPAILHVMDQIPAYR